MAGIFPSGGTDPQNTLNAVVGRVIAGCKALFYRSNCNPRFDPVATNALISELINAVNRVGLDYDCSRLDNLGIAIQKGDGTLTYPRFPVDRDDAIRGAYDGQEGWTSVKELLEVGPGALDAVDYIDPVDYIFIGSYTGTSDEFGQKFIGRRIRLSDFKTHVIPAPPSGGFGANYSWKDMISARGVDIPYRNNYDSAIQVNIMLTGDYEWVYVSRDGTNWIQFGVGAGNSQEHNTITPIIPPGGYYMCKNANIQAWTELTPD